MKIPTPAPDPARASVPSPTGAAQPAVPASGRSRVAVIGGGAIGGVLAAALDEAGHDVVVCVRTHFDELVIETNTTERRRVPVTIATRPDGLTPRRWVLLAVKAHDTDSVAHWLTALADENTTVVVLQNGVDQAEPVQRLVPAARVLPALVYVAAERLAPGLIRHGFGGRISVPAGLAADELAKLFSGSQVEIGQETDFTAAAWRKLLVNVAINPITALTLRRIEVFEDAELRELARGLMNETLAVGVSRGVDLTEQDIQNALKVLDQFTEQDGTSMLYDRLAGLPLEHDALNGAVVRAATSLGIDVPLNRTLLALVRALA